MSAPRSRLAGCLAFILSLALAAPVGAQESPSPAASPGPPASLSPEASALAVEAQAILLEVFAQTAESPDEAAAAARAAEIERTGLAEVDPEAAATLAELEAQAAEELATFLAAAPPLLPEPSGEPSPEPSPGPSTSPKAGSSAFLAAVVRAPHDDQRFAQGGSYLSSIGQVLGYASRLIGDFQPSKGSGSGTAEPLRSGGGSYRIDLAFDRDTLTLIIAATERYTVPGTSPESSPFEVTDTGSTTLQVDTCPDEDGTIVVTANASGTYDVVGEGLSYHASLDTNDHANVTVNDDAEIAGREHALTVRGSAVGDRPAFAGGAGAVDSQLQGTLTWSGEASAPGAPSVDLTTAEGVDARDLRSAFTGGAFTAALVDAAINAAAIVWQDGRCLELEVDPPGKTVDSGSETEITVKIMHKAFDEEVERDVEATLEGTEEVDPLDAPVRAPDTFTYTATSAPEGEGTITFRSVSNRGIAEERSETYRVDLRLLLDVDMRVTYRSSGVSARGTIKGRGLRVTPIAADPATGEAPGVTVEGDLDFRGRASSPGCQGDYRGAFPVDSAKNASATIAGEGEDRRLVLSLRLADPSAKLTAQIRCQGASVGLPIPVGRMMPRTSIELPLAGGTLARRGNESGARWRATFTLRVDRSG